VAWMRTMGAESVAYNRRTVLERGDDFPGMALTYYASRGETPLRWGGTGAEALGLDGPASAEAKGRGSDQVYNRLHGAGVDSWWLVLNGTLPTRLLGESLGSAPVVRRMPDPSGTPLPIGGLFVAGFQLGRYGLGHRQVLRSCRL
jgi:hypothetical protein